MPKEVEHKFLVHENCLPKLGRGKKLVQGYLSTRPTIRVRVVSGAGKTRSYLTIKGPGFLERDEFEYEIPAADARKLLKLCGAVVLEKIRYEIDGWEIDEFLGRHKGLWLAEYELKSTRAKLPNLPEWIGEEVTGDPAYSNSNLAMTCSLESIF